MGITEIKKLFRANNIDALKFLGTYFSCGVYRDEKAKKFMKNARLYLQFTYGAVDTKNPGHYVGNWKGRKWYLSSHMTEDEVIKTAYLAFKMAVEHEVMESFKINGVALFNPHVDYKELVKISHKEITRT